MGREGFELYLPIKPVTVCFRARPSLKAKLYTTPGESEKFASNTANRRGAETR